jgi:hypothetical protein
MEDWQQDWWKAWETVMEEMEQFYLGVVQEVDATLDVVLDASDDTVDRFYEAIAPSLAELDQQIEEWMEPVILAAAQVEMAIQEAAEPLSRTIEPWLNDHPVCVGCRHYHGHSYGGQMLVCAMHPYGVSTGETTCPDKELLSWSERSHNRYAA